jgi:hypothetical protein
MSDESTVESIAEDFLNSDAEPEATQTQTEETNTTPPEENNTPPAGSEDEDFDNVAEAMFKKAADRAGNPEDKEGSEETKEEDKGTKDETKSEEEDSDDDTKDMTPSAGQRFKQIKAEVKEANATIAKLQAELESTSSKVPDAAEAAERDAELEKLREQVDKYKGERSAYLIEQTEEYAEQVTQPLARLGKAATALAARSGVSEDAMIQALEESDPKVQNELLGLLADDMNTRDSTKLFNIVDEIELVFENQDRLRENSSEAMSEIQARKEEAAAKEAEMASKQYKAAAETVFESLNKRLGLGDGHEGIRSEGEAYNLREADAGTQAYSVYAGLLLPEVAQARDALQKQVNELEESLAKFQSVTPGAGAGSKPDLTKAKLSSTEFDWDEIGEEVFKEAGW